MKQALILRWYRWSALTALVAGGVVLGFAAQTPEGARTVALSLEEAVRLALANNPDLRASRARAESAAGRAYQTKKWTNPELELNAEDWPASGGRGFSDAKQTIGIAQTLPYPGKKSLDKQIGGAGVKLAEAELAVRRTEIVRDVKAGFFRVLASERLAEVSTQLVVAAESSAATARKRVDAGAAAYQEQLRAEVQLEQARTELAGFQRELSTARQIFFTLLGRPDLKDAPLSGALAEVPDAKLVDTSSEGWLAQHPSATAAQANLARAQLGYRRARLEPYPDVKVGASGGRIGATDESIIQLGLTIPLPILDRGKGKQQEAQANVRVAEAELQSVQQQLQREWANAQQRYHTAVEQVSNYRERILPKAVGSRRVGDVREGQRRFPLVVRLPDKQRTDPDALAATLIPTAGDPVLPLKQVAKVTEMEGPPTINREWGKRRATVQCNVRGRDVKSFVTEAKAKVAAEVRLPAGYTVEWGGQFENMERANQKLMFVAPMALALIFVLLFLSLKTLRDVLVVVSGIPLGLVGGVLALWLRQMPFTVSSAIGFIALSGVAILNGLVLATFIKQKLGDAAPLEKAVREGCLVRLRPVLMTALVAAVGFIPMAVNVGVGGEVQRPLATVVIGGIFTNTLLTLLVLPALYTTFRRRKPDGSEVETTARGSQTATACQRRAENGVNSPI